MCGGQETCKSSYSRLNISTPPTPSYALHT